jgi:hypothetical protein
MMRGRKLLKKWASVCHKWKRKWIMTEIDCFDILNKKLRLVNESPDTRNRRVTASRSATGIAFRNDVSFFLILGPTKLINASKSKYDILQNVLKCKFSTLRLHRKSLPLYPSRLLKMDVIHHRRFLNFSFLEVNALR